MSASFEDTLATIWVRQRPALLARLGPIDAAVAARAAGAGSAALDEAGRAEAHRLAGLLGTFGRHDGTEPARALEGALAVPGADADELARRAAALRAVIER